MTNTLHRYGDAQSFSDDFVIFATPCYGKNDDNCVPKLKAFLEMALAFHPVNAGDGIHGSAWRPARKMSPVAHWTRDARPNFRSVIDGVDEPTTVAVVFDNLTAAEAFIRAVKEADFGLSINISTSVDGAEQCCDAAGLRRHSIAYSVALDDRRKKLPSGNVLMLTSMCGHGMVSANFANKMIEWVREGRRTPEQAATYMARFCSCGVYNPSRAMRILRKCAQCRDCDDPPVVGQTDEFKDP